MGYSSQKKSYNLKRNTAIRSRFNYISIPIKLWYIFYWNDHSQKISLTNIAKQIHNGLGNSIGGNNIVGDREYLLKFQYKRPHTINQVDRNPESSDDAKNNGDVADHEHSPEVHLLDVCL